MKKNNQKTLFSAPGGKSYLVPFILITSLFLLWGFAHGLLDVLNKHFQGVFTMTKAESGLVQFSTYIAYFLMALPAGMFMKRFGYKKGIILGLCLFAVGAFAFIPAAYLHSASPFLIALFVIACGLCILETAANPYSTILGPEESGAQRLNLSQSFNGLGWILGPLVGGMLIFGGEESDPFTLTKPYILVGSFFSSLPNYPKYRWKKIRMRKKKNMYPHPVLPPCGDIRSLSGLLLHSFAIVLPRREFSVSSLIM